MTSFCELSDPAVGPSTAPPKPRNLILNTS